jgi:phosphoglycerate dehydrogenase-like enzyme
MHGSYNEHLSTHAVAFLLAFARRFEHYLPQKRWQRGPGMIDLPTQTVLIVGIGGAGSNRASSRAPASMSSTRNRCQPTARYGECLMC